MDVKVSDSSAASVFRRKYVTNMSPRKVDSYIPDYMASHCGNGDHNICCFGVPIKVSNASLSQIR